MYLAPAPFYESCLQNLLEFYCVKCFHPIVAFKMSANFYEVKRDFSKSLRSANCPANFCNLLTCAKTSEFTSYLACSLSFVISSTPYFATYKGDIVMLLSYLIFYLTHSKGKPFRSDIIFCCIFLYGPALNWCLLG